MLDLEAKQSWAEILFRLDLVQGTNLNPSYLICKIGLLMFTTKYL